MSQPKAVNTDKQVADAKAKASKHAIRVKDCPGLYLRVTPSGTKTFAAVARDPHGKQIWATIGGTELTLDPSQPGNVREKAREAIRRIKAGEDPFPSPPAKPDSFESVAENWYTRHVKAKGLRSAGEIRRQLDSYILPAWKGCDFAAIRKSDVAKLLDEIEDKVKAEAKAKGLKGRDGATAADRVLATVRAIMRWQAARDDDYVCVVTGKLRRTEPKARRRKRTLDDAEIRLVWAAAPKAGAYGAMAQLGLLTGQRRAKIAGIGWDDVTIDGHWKVATEDREKGNGETLPLPRTALDIIRAQRRVNGNPFVFAGRGEGHFQGYGKGKAALDAEIAKANDGKAIPAWEFHDLRRTARSLLARAGVSTEIAKKVLGHADDAIQATYNRHAYTKERGDALKKLAGLLAIILAPKADNVRPLKQRAKR